MGIAWIGEAGRGQAQKIPGDVARGVHVAGLEGHKSRSAVYLIHKGLGRRRADERRVHPHASSGKKRMLSQAECERPVTGDTNREREAEAGVRALRWLGCRRRPERLVGMERTGLGRPRYTGAERGQKWKSRFKGAFE